MNRDERNPMAEVLCHNKYEALTPVSEDEEEEALVSASVTEAKLHPETLTDLEREWQAVFLKYGSYFGENKEQSDYFAMLPLTSDQRRTVLERARQLENEKATNK